MGARLKELGIKDEIKSLLVSKQNGKKLTREQALEELRVSLRLLVDLRFGGRFSLWRYASTVRKEVM